MATHEFDWREIYTTDGSTIHRCEVKARKGVGVLVMDAVQEQGTDSWRADSYYWLESEQRDMPLYQKKGIDSSTTRRL